MRRLIQSVVLSCFCMHAVSQTAASDEALLTKARALYDAPFTRGLISFDCAVQFDWKKHFAEFVEPISPAAVLTAERLQGVQHRVFVDRSGAVVSAVPKAPDFTGIPEAATFEQVFNAMSSEGLKAWLPSSMNVILPVGSTQYVFRKIEPGYKLTMTGQGVAATLLMKDDLRVTSGVAERPQPFRFTTEFANGPDGYLLQSVTTGSTSDGSSGGDATFTYTYQLVQGVQLPSLVTVIPSTTKAWHFVLTDCKVVKGVVIKVGPPTQ